MSQRRRSSTVPENAEDSHAFFINRSRNLISLTRDHIVKLNDMSTEIREMTERLFTEDDDPKPRSTRRRSSVKYETKVVIRTLSQEQHRRKNVNTGNLKNVSTPTDLKVSQQKSSAHPAVKTKAIKDVDLNFLEIHGKSSLEKWPKKKVHSSINCSPRPGDNVSDNKECNLSIISSYSKDDKSLKKMKNKNDFKPPDTDTKYNEVEGQSSFVLNGRDKGFTSSNASVFRSGRFRNRRPTLHLPQIHMDGFSADNLNTPHSSRGCPKDVSMVSSPRATWMNSPQATWITIPYRCPSLHKCLRQ